MHGHLLAEELSEQLGWGTRDQPMQKSCNLCSVWSVIDSSTFITRRATCLQLIVLMNTAMDVFFLGGGGPHITPPEYLMCIILHWKNLCLLVSGILTQVTVWDINNA